MDPLDKAKELEMFQRDQALANQKARAQQPPQLVIDGVVHCLHCAAEIPAERLAVLPDAAYCIGCQSYREGSWKR